MMKKKPMKLKSLKILYSAILLIILSIIASFILDIKSIIITLLSLILLTSYIIYKEKIGQELIIAFLIALVITSHYVYEYTTLNIIIGRINLFPLISWTTGLVILREIYERLKFKNKFIAITIIYIISLFLLEYIGFYLFNIRLKSNLPSLLGIGVIHASLPMQFFYLVAGPIYIIITNYLKVK